MKRPVIQLMEVGGIESNYAGTTVRTPVTKFSVPLTYRTELDVAAAGTAGHGPEHHGPIMGLACERALISL